MAQFHALYIAICSVNSDGICSGLEPSTPREDYTEVHEANLQEQHQDVQSPRAYSTSAQTLQLNGVHNNHEANKQPPVFRSPTPKVSICIINSPHAHIANPPEPAVLAHTAWQVQFTSIHCWLASCLGHTVACCILGRSLWESQCVVGGAIRGAAKYSRSQAFWASSSTSGQVIIRGCQPYSGKAKSQWWDLWTLCRALPFCISTFVHETA